MKILTRISQLMSIFVNFYLDIKAFFTYSFKGIGNSLYWHRNCFRFLQNKFIYFDELR